MPLVLLALVGMVLAAVLPGWVVEAVLRLGAEPEGRFAEDAGTWARRVLSAEGATGVDVQATGRDDYYDVEARAVRLRLENMRGRSLTAYAVAAQQVGHALQDAEDYPPLLRRSAAVAWADRLQWAGIALMLATPLLVMLLRQPRMLLLFAGGLLALSSAVLVHLWVHPVSQDASVRALRVLPEHAGVHDGRELQIVRQLVRAASFVPLARACLTLLDVKRWVQILFRRLPR